MSSHQNEITHGLKQFFGSEREVKLEVKVKEVEPPKTTQKDY